MPRIKRLFSCATVREGADDGSCIFAKSRGEICVFAGAAVQLSGLYYARRWSEYRYCTLLETVRTHLHAGESVTARRSPGPRETREVAVASPAGTYMAGAAAESRRFTAAPVSAPSVAYRQRHADRVCVPARRLHNREIRAVDVTGPVEGWQQLNS